MVILVLFLLVVLLASAAFSVDVAYMHLSRTQLRSATDAAARAGAEAVTRTGDVDAAREAVKSVAASNWVAGKPLVLLDEHIVFGKTAPQEDGVMRFVPGEEPFNSVQITGDRSRNSPSGEVSLFFGRVLGTEYFEPSFTSVAARAGSPKRDLCVVADRSHSMAFDLSGEDWAYPPAVNGGNGKCFPPHPTLSRWAVLVQSLNGFFAALQDTEDEERVGLVTYAGAGNYCGERYQDSTIDHLLTDSHGSIQSFLVQRSQEPIPGATNIHAGIMDGIKVLEDRARAREDAKKIMVVMTDGRHNRGADPIHAANVAASREIQIIAITFSAGADQVRMRRVAEVTGGSHYHAPTADELRRIFKQVASGLEDLVFIQ